MVITGALPCSINTMDTGDIAFDLHIKTSGGGTPMPELEDHQTFLICTPGKNSKLGTSLTVSMPNAISKGLPMLTASLLIVFSSSYGKLLAGAQTTPLLIFKTN